MRAEAASTGLQRALGPVQLAPPLALVACACMAGPVVIDILGKLAAGEWLPAAFGVRNSRLRRAVNGG